MLNGIKLIIYFVIVVIIILFIKFNKKIINFIKENLRVCSICILIFILFISYACLSCFFNFKTLYYQVLDTLGIEDTSNDSMFEMSTIKINEENTYYQSEITSLVYNINTSMNPYIPDGYTYVEGKWNNGFVIEDNNKNQYVWVPCGDNDYIEYNICKLSKMNFYTKDDAILFEDCYDEDYEEFISSALSNGGFYISRYEIGIDNNKLVSKKDVKIYEVSNKDILVNKIGKMNIGCSIKSKIINGYAYDTVMNWIKNTNNIEVFKYQKSDEILTGRESYNNIYDLTDNVLEFIDEILYDTYVMRGFLSIEEDNYKYRFNITENLLYNYTNDIIGTRSIIYK